MGMGLFFVAQKQYELQQYRIEWYEIHILCATTCVFAYARCVCSWGGSGEIHWYHQMLRIRRNGVFVNANQQTNHDSDLPVLLFYPTTGVQRVHFIHIDACTAISIRMHVASKYMCTQQFKLVFRAWICRGKNELSNMLFPFNEYRVIRYLMATLLDIWVYILNERSHRARAHTHKTEYNVCYFIRWPMICSVFCDMFSHWHKYPFATTWTCLDICSAGYRYVEATITNAVATAAAIEKYIL